MISSGADILNAHEPVLKAELISTLRPIKNGIYVDCTVGAAGHTLAILQSCGDCFVIGLDVDPNALKIAEERLKMFERSVKLIRESYGRIEDILNRLSVEKVDGIIADLGLSSMQIDDPKRGFSFRFDSPLDMRMDPSKNLTAWNVVNEYPEEKLYKVIKEYGEEPFAKRIAREIVKNRPINTTGELVEIIRKAIPSKSRNRRKRHFATRTFQAIRIEVNKELENLQSLLRASERVLKKGGRIAIISFHSLEDRIVKHFFRKSEHLLPLTKKPITPSKDEIQRNPRSRSAKLRVAERI